MPDYRALAQALGTSQPTPQEIERMAALQSPAFGVFPQMQPYRSQQDITASANVPVDVLRGRIAGTRGLFGDVVNQPIPMVRPLQLLSQAFTGQQKYPDTEHYLDTMPLKSDTPIGDVAGRIGSFAPINPMPAVRAGQKGLNLLGMEVADRLATGRSVLPSLLKEPQSAMFAVQPIDLNKGIYKPELTMDEMLKVKDIPTVDRVKQSIDLVGEDQFKKMVNAQYQKYKPTDQDQEAMLVESVTLNILGKAQRSPVEYPLAPAGTRYEEFGGKLTYMTPDEFLQRVRPLQLDPESLDNIAALKQHVQSGGKLDPLHIYETGKEDGRHRAYLAKELGIEKIPVALHGKQSFQYPQQEALRLAQERASLPVEQGGLGLPKDNTPEMRYQAMKGIEGNFVHGAKEPDITSFKTKKQLFEEKYANNPEGAIADNHYANERNAVFLSPNPQFTENFSVQGYTDVGQAPTSYPLKVVGDTKVFDFENPQHLEMLKQKYAELFPLKTIGKEGYVPSEESIRMHTINKRIENLPNDVNNWPAMENKDFQRAIQELGFDAFHVNERGTKNIGVYDPSTLRSPFAAFDPFRKDVATATAMGVALPDLLAAEAEDKKKKLSKVLTK